MSKHPRPTPTSFTLNHAVDEWPDLSWLPIAVLIIDLVLVVMCFAFQAYEAALFLAGMSAGIGVGWTVVLMAGD